MADLWDEDWSEAADARPKLGASKRLALLALPLLILGAWLALSRLELGASRPAAAPLPPILLDLERWDAAAPEDQDRAAAAVAERLKPAYAFVDIQRYACGGAAHRIARFRHEGTGLEMMLLPGGRYQMGSDQGKKDEKPAHPVHIRRPFLLGRFELNQEQWDRVGGEDQRYRHDPGLPIEGFSWYAARDWLAAAGDGLRLPSESEWEYACRAGTTTRYYWGDEVDGAHCWYQKNAGFQTHAGAEHAAASNAFGLVDMAGNVEELCEDGYFFDYAGGPADEGALSTADVPRRDARRYLRVGRGGSWNSRPRELRSAERNAVSRNRGDKNLGMRAAASLP